MKLTTGANFTTCLWAHVDEIDPGVREKPFGIRQIFFTNLI